MASARGTIARQEKEGRDKGNGMVVFMALTGVNAGEAEVQDGDDKSMMILAATAARTLTNPRAGLKDDSS